MIWSLMILCGIITFLMRFIPLSGIIPRELSPSIKNSFKYIPLAVLTPIIVNELSILENNQDADVILLNHVGVTDFKNLHDLWNNIPFPAPLHFNTERLSRSELPPISQPETLIENIDQLWEKFDLWVLSNQK